MGKNVGPADLKSLKPDEGDSVARGISALGKSAVGSEFINLLGVLVGIKP